MYKIYGDNFIIKINSIGVEEKEEEKKSTYIDFSNCENKLRKFYNITQDRLLTVFQFEINKNNSQSLINQVEYAIFDEYYRMLDLSICSNEKINIFYSIVNTSLINDKYILYYKDMGIDIFNFKDDFFNDICYSYSEHNSDMILKDRIKYIFQNYSVCDKNCEYENIDIQNMRIKCNCQVKTSINTKLEEPTYNKLIFDIFKHTEIGVIKCYKLVFNLNKKNNIGFWIFLILILFQVPFIINYIIFKDKTIKKYIKEQLIILSNPKILNPIKKNLKLNPKNYKNYINSKKINILRNKHNKSDITRLLNDSSISKKTKKIFSLNKYNNSLKGNKNINIMITNSNYSLKNNKIKKKLIMI